MENKNIIIEKLNEALTVDELKNIYRKAVKIYHPDSDNGNDIERYLAIAEAYERNLEKLNVRQHAINWRREAKQKTVNGKTMIARQWANVAEFLNADGEEQLSALKAMVKSVSRRLYNATPTPNKKQITDKHKADINGNMDGMRTYNFAKYCYNARHLFNEEKVEEVAHNAYIKLAENMYNGKYDGEKVSTILWISCRQALYNTWYDEAKRVSWFDRQHDVYETDAYQTTAPTDWTTEATAVTRVYIDELNSKVLQLAEMGYNCLEISNMLDMNVKTVWNQIKAHKAQFDIDRIQLAMNGDTETGTRKNANPIKQRKALIMKAIGNGMSYRRIAYHIGIADIRNKNGEITCSITDQIRTMLSA